MRFSQSHVSARPGSSDFLYFLPQHHLSTLAIAEPPTRAASAAANACLSAPHNSLQQLPTIMADSDSDDAPEEVVSSKQRRPSAGDDDDGPEEASSSAQPGGGGEDAPRKKRARTTGTQRRLAAAVMHWDPGKLRAALNALKFALDHPVTSHTTAAPTHRGGLVPYANRPTKAYLNRKLPRRPYQLKEKPGESALRDADAAKRRAANVMQTNALHEIGSVLDQMNHNVLQAATEFDDEPVEVEI